MRLRTKRKLRKQFNSSAVERFTKRRTAGLILLFCVSAILAITILPTKITGKASRVLQISEEKAGETLYRNVMDYYIPLMNYEQKKNRTLSQVIYEAVFESFPLYTYVAAQGKETAMDDGASRETMAMADDSGSYDFLPEDKEALQAEAELEFEAYLEQQMEAENQNYGLHDQNADFLGQGNYQDMAARGEQTLFSYATGKQKTIDLEELTDYKTLVSKHYRIDGTTGSNSGQLNVKKLLKKDMAIEKDADGPQILIYHTHSQEGYKDSTPGVLSESVVGLGDELTSILKNRYGLNVLHDRGTYDVQARDRAYSVAGPALEKILKKYPTIEVVIDLHRDGVGADTYLLTEVNDTPMASIMFFNGLSYTNKNGKLASLANPNLDTNLAFSLHMELLAEEYYPGLTRGIYLKGLRYNLHYCPKSLLVEVGAQTNSLQEAMNAMPPLADILNRVLSGEKP